MHTCTHTHTATVRMAGAMEKSTDVMKAMQSLMKVGEVRETMMALSKEMNKVGGSGAIASLQLLIASLYVAVASSFVCRCIC